MGQPPRSAGVALLVLVPLWMQVCTSDSMRRVAERVTQKVGGPSIGLVMAYSAEQLTLQSSGFFISDPQIPCLDLAGRRFHVGKINEVAVVYVMTGEQSINAAMTVQLLIDVFDVQGIVHYGIAGSTNDSLSAGDVSVMNSVAFTGSWTWKEFNSKEGGSPALDFGAFNVPQEGQNLLAEIEFTPQQIYAPGKPMQEMFWLPLDANWLNIAMQLKNLKLQQCVNDTSCRPDTPKVVYGLRGCSADIFLDNAAYREYLFKKFNVSTADEETAAVAMTCLSNGVPCIAFRGISDLAGGHRKLSSSSSLSPLASVNALSAAVSFIGLIKSELRQTAIRSIPIVQGISSVTR